MHRKLQIFLVVIAAIVIAAAIVLVPAISQDSSAPTTRTTDTTGIVIIGLTVFGAAWVYNEKQDARHDATEKAVERLILEQKATLDKIEDLKTLLQHEANHRRSTQKLLSDLTEWAERRTPGSFHQRPGSAPAPLEDFTGPLSPWADPHQL